MQAEMLMLQREEQEEILRHKEQPKFSLFCWRLLHMGHAVNRAREEKIRTYSGLGARRRHEHEGRGRERPNVPQPGSGR